MRLLVMGNSGSGKSTFARAAILQYPDHELLELDMIVWEPHQIAVARPAADVLADLAAFVDARDDWVIEGCDGDLVEHALPRATELVFMNPGVQACLDNNRRRPYEPHKYDSPDDQARMLDNLLAWVESYYTRTDPRSYAFHRRIYDTFRGTKREVIDLADLRALRSGRG